MSDQTPSQTPSQTPLSNTPPSTQQPGPLEEELPIDSLPRSDRVERQPVVVDRPNDVQPYRVGMPSSPVTRLPAGSADSPMRQLQRARSKLKRFFVDHWEHEHETTLFLFVSLLDFFCTYTLLTTAPAGGVRHIESNPVAAWFLNHYGVVKGLLGFKLAMVIVVCGLAQVVSFTKPTAGKGILLFGTLLTAAVVAYSIALLARAIVP